MYQLPGVTRLWVVGAPVTRRIMIAVHPPIAVRRIPSDTADIRRCGDRHAVHLYAAQAVVRDAVPPVAVPPRQTKSAVP